VKAWHHQVIYPESLRSTRTVHQGNARRSAVHAICRTISSPSYFHPGARQSPASPTNIPGQLAPLPGLPPGSTGAAPASAHCTQTASQYTLALALTFPDAPSPRRSSANLTLLSARSSIPTRTPSIAFYSLCNSNLRLLSQPFGSFLQRSSSPQLGGFFFSPGSRGRATGATL
jgi:hypothetical protein